MASGNDSPGADPSNLWGNARGGSALHTELKPRAEPSPGGARDGDAIRLQQVSRTYRDRRGAGVHALAGVSLHAGHGELLAVVGPSGCG